MGWKLVRDKNEAWCRANGVSGRWRTSPDPAAALRRKIVEEAGEYLEDRDPAELYDLLDVVQALIGLKDPDGRFAREHALKVADLGGFTRFIEWTPIPAGTRDWSPDSRTPETPASPCPVEAVFGPDDRVPCLLERGHDGPHQYTPEPCGQCGCLPADAWGCGCSNEDCPCSEAEDEECE